MISYVEKDWIIDGNGDVVICLHGYGSSSPDLESLGTRIKSEIPNSCVLGINAPLQLEQGGYSWFKMGKNINNWISGMRNSFDYIKERINHHGILDRKIIFTGFSQGGIVSAYSAFLGKESFDNCQNIVGAISLSGGALLEKKPSLESKFCMIHGTEDSVIPLLWSAQTIFTLKSWNIDHDFHVIEGMNHEINSEACKKTVQTLKKWING
ncbi:alpha/beta hydrolase [Candidatus Nesciobacter abundans]|uniref:Phospholipase/carboxylesterase/thioesterase domain-containing protein n=1 Tax=Candidatus Nesciobacter abundans TaxID=2601668 RepID=A0A5C0UHB3_9PROT|nr:hypothetical protein [Candidatus Nesciobacter abundans]QEK39097.1 hypothetical protein FZC36_01440 [Candidatus Nesciobacter abundans]